MKSNTYLLKLKGVLFLCFPFCKIGGLLQNTKTIYIFSNPTKSKIQDVSFCRNVSLKLLLSIFLEAEPYFLHFRPIYLFIMNNYIRWLTGWLVWHKHDKHIQVTPMELWKQKPSLVTYPRDETFIISQPYIVDQKKKNKNKILTF